MPDRDRPAEIAAGRDLRAPQHVRMAATEFYLPSPDAEVMCGVRWGRFDELFTPAYWAVQMRMAGTVRPGPVHRLGATLAEETAACLLGGHGIPAEVGLAAFERLRTMGLLEGRGVSEADLIAALSEPMRVGGREVRYRFPRQKARYLHAALRRLGRGAPGESDHRAFRTWFLESPGVGLKTASWITRNWLDSDSVAVVDVHVHRAGLLAGFYVPRHDPRRDYFEMEALFLEFAGAIGARPSSLDALLWCDLRAAGRLVPELVRRARAVG